MRLIDADKLMEDIIKICKCQPYLEGMQSEIVYIQDVIDEQPTAFDVDEVVEQLEEKSKMNLKKGLIEVLPDEARPYLKAVESFDKAIEIVKRGGIDE